jgi:polyribonucleotide nucleotidyltransferase
MAEVLKMPAPKSAVSKIIGTKGGHAKEIAQRTGCRISISRRIEGWMSW